jgi:hypothetical protein
MTLDTQMTLALLQELLMALRANDADGYKSWLALGIEQLGRDVADEVESEWMVPLLGKEERDRLIAWKLGVSLQSRWEIMEVLYPQRVRTWISCMTTSFRPSCLISASVALLMKLWQPTLKPSNPALTGGGFCRFCIDMLPIERLDSLV